ncbi:MAG: PAS domain S-box protein, partial [Gemmatimonadetes bacterium]|nr:PAS domain S-box protein [Gemmatimonadota bacterium]
MATVRGDAPDFGRLAETFGDVVYRVRVRPVLAIEYVSPGVAALTGRGPEDYYSSAELFLESAHPDDREMLRALLDSPPDAVSPVVIRFVRPDGSVVWVELGGVAVRDGERRVVAVEGLARDVTLRMAAARELEKERNFVTGILDTTDALVVVLDPAGRIVSLNRACELASGHSNEEARGVYVWDFARPPSQAGDESRLFRGLKAGDFPRRRESEWATRSGGRRLIAWSDTAMVDSSGRVDFVIATGVDITEQREAERQIRLLGTAVESAADMVMITNEEGVIQYVNEAFTQATGYSREEAVDTTATVFQGVGQVGAFR